VKNLIESVTSPLLFLNKERKIQLANSSFERLSGYSKSELVGKNIEEIGLKVDLKGHIEQEWKIKDGHKLLVSIDCNQSEDNFLLTFEDRTERSQLIELINELKLKERTSKGLIIRTGFLSKKVVEGDLTQRIHVENLPSWMAPMGKNINKMISSIEWHEKEIIKSKRFSDSIIRYWPNEGSLLTLDGTRIKTNLCAERLSSYTDEELKNTKLEKIYAKEDSDKIRDAFEECKKTGFSACEATSIERDGSKIPRILSFGAIRDEKGDVTNILGSSTDITELREREEEITRTKTYFETLLEGVATPIWLFDLDGAVTYANSTSEEILGYKKEECVGNSLDEFLSKFIHTKEIPEAKQLIKEGTMLEKKIRTRVYSLLSKEGAEILTLVSYVPIVNPKGERMGLIITATDISELRNTQEELDETKQFASSLFSNFSLPASLFNTIGERLDVNKASVRFFKRCREDLIGAKLEDLYEKEDTFKLLDALSECKKYGQGTCEVTAIKGDGTRVPAISYFSPIENKLGEVTRIIGVLHIA